MDHATDLGGPLSSGTPAQVADGLEAWVAETDVDGFNLAYALMPGTFVDIVDQLVPELQRRSRYKTAYRDGTLRRKRFGSDTRQALRPGRVARAAES